MIFVGFYKDNKRLGALYFGMGVLLVIILLYVIPGIGYIVGRYKVRKQVIAEHGAINRKILKKELKKNKYCTLFIGMNTYLLLLLYISAFIIVFFMYVVFIIGADFFAGLFNFFLYCIILWVIFLGLKLRRLLT